MNNENNTGGPAFPVPNDANVNGEPGMTLRDYFAAKAMQGALSNEARLKLILESEGKPADSLEAQDKLAIRCYNMADAMLKAREQ